MRIYLQEKDKVLLLPSNELFKVFCARNFFTDDETRKRFADELGGKEGRVIKTEHKYAFDYFIFSYEYDEDTFSIPYESVDFSEYTWF